MSSRDFFGGNRNKKRVKKPNRKPKRYGHGGGVRGGRARGPNCNGSCSHNMDCGPGCV